MGMVDLRKGFEMHDELHFIDAIIVENGDFLPGVKVSMYVNLVVSFRNARPFHEWFHRDNRPVPIVDMSPRLKLLYEELELFTVELLVQCLRFATKKVELP